MEAIIAADKENFMGKQVKLNEVKVQGATGGRAFWIDASPAQQMLVVLDKEKTPGSPTEGRYLVFKLF